MSAKLFVNYTFVDQTKGLMYCMCDVDVENPITEMQDIIRMANDISEKWCNGHQVVIHNWQRFEDADPHVTLGPAMEQP